MSFQEDKNQLIEYITQGMRYSENEQELEEFFEFLDELEAKALMETQYYALVADAYATVVHNPKKAKEAFLKVYDPKNKKDVKKLLDYDRWKGRPVVRPSKRVVKALPQFKYAAAEVLKNKFIKPKGSVCSVCGKKSVPLYIGNAYTASGELTCFADRSDQFCAACIKDGAAAKAFDIRFNSPILEELTAYDADQINELAYRTPECSSVFERCDEDVWPTCCGDFCRYVKYDSGEERFYFQCTRCGREIVWGRED